MSQPSKIARSLYIVAITPIYIGGLLYSFIQEYMPYHAVAVGQSWDALEPSMQVLILATLNGVGGMILCIAIAMTLLLLIPFRRGELWASWAITAIGSACMLVATRSAIYVDANTAANPPWFIFIATIMILILALLFSIKSQSGR